MTAAFGKYVIAILLPQATGYLVGGPSPDVRHISRYDVAHRYIDGYYGGVLEMAVLGLLRGQDMHGYELKKRLSDVFGVSSAVSFGSLYPALARLEAAGAVRALGDVPGLVTGGPGPAAGHRADRRRKVYGITGLGTKMFEDLLRGTEVGGDDERSFHLRLAFARYLPAESRLGLLEQRRAVLGERLARLASRARARRDDRYMRALSDRQHEVASGDVSWLDHLIEEERASAAATGPSSLVGGLGRPPTHPQARLVPLASASQLQRPAPRAPGAQALAPR